MLIIPGSRAECCVRRGRTFLVNRGNAKGGGRQKKRWKIRQPEEAKLAKISGDQNQSKTRTLLKEGERKLALESTTEKDEGKGEQTLEREQIY